MAASTPEVETTGTEDKDGQAGGINISQPLATLRTENGDTLRRTGNSFLSTLHYSRFFYVMRGFLVIASKLVIY